jgi:hypothetical protein
VLSVLFSIKLYHPYYLYPNTMLFAPLLLLISAAQALPWDVAKPTRNIGHPLRYHERPKPTEVIDLRKRQAPGDITCAWENGEGTSGK